MLNMYRIIKDYIPLGTKLYIKNLDKYVILEPLMTKINLMLLNAFMRM